MPVSLSVALLLGSIPAAPISGRVLVAGTPPARPVVQVNVDKKFCGTERATADLEVAPDGALANAVVSLEDPPPGSLKDAPREVEVRQEGCVFSPHVVLLPPGGALRFTNGDPIAHQVRLLGAVPQNAMQTRNVWVSRRFDAPGEYPVRCDIHPWMSAWGVVMRHPYYAVTDAAGRFSIDAPPGRYQVRVWHETLGVLHGSVTAGTPASFTFTIAPPGAPPPPPKAAIAQAMPEERPTLARKLQSIQELRDHGVLSQDEYRRIVDLLIADAR